MKTTEQTRSVKDVEKEGFVPHIWKHQGDWGGFDAHTSLLLGEQSISVSQLIMRLQINLYYNHIRENFQ